MIEPDDFEGYEPPNSTGVFLVILLAVIGAVGGIMWLLAVALGVL